MTLVYLLAGEASGDLLGGRLMAALRRRLPGVQFAGVGGERMAEQGLESLFPMRELSLMGLLEVLPNLRRLAARMDQAEADILARRPAVLVTIDAPSFTLRLAGRVRPKGTRVVHYVAPQVWAWRPGRVRKIARRVDRILALLPFEAPFFEAAGIPVTFVGHPVLEGGADQGDAARFRAQHGLSPADRVLLVMPGSRRTEVNRLLDVFGEALRLTAAAVPGLRPVVPLAGQVEAAVRAGTASWPVRPILVRAPAEKHDAFAAAAEPGGAGLIKSGTSSLEMAVAGVPHVVAYKVNPVTAAIVRRLIQVPHASLVNLLAEREVVPERLQENCTPAALSAALLPLLQDPAAAAAQRSAFAGTLAQLRPAEGLPSEAAAAAVVAELQRQGGAA
ncbi:lipid-A-disaccharide synthase [Paracraurococcus ruber]|uniref:Lipid-A-disaccharide synthase n=1 Tax=Paracraurococcus ruber TaxID=77675 RepID=A0ABS1D064_9PROT|nr:lipid-A-disaccharide synthase [Paracraurococcus ruber]MBK1660188.1 lipid-A-disaccharide synthase [Paracraurococcus ruber]TDG28343.1 lipid-A-disaccharide synthase [Paracraurococcus ruber]